MPFAIPTLADLVNRARLAFRANLPGSDAWVWPNNVGPAAKVIGGAVNEVFGFADYVQRQKFALTADGENLDRHGAELGLPRRPASPGVGNIVITVSDAYQVAAGAVFQRADGVQYSANAGAVAAGAGTITVPVTAVQDGLLGNAAAGTPVALVTGFTDLNNDAQATAAVDANGIVLGGDVEADGDYFTPQAGTYRYRILFRKRFPPHGGNASDYVIWAGAVPGVSRVFVERLWAGPGTVRVFPLMDAVYPGGIPQPGDIYNVAQAIAPLQPATAMVTVAAPAAVPVNITIAGFSPNTVTSQQAVLAELAQTFLQYGTVAGNDVVVSSMPFLATPTSFALMWLNAAVVNAAGSPRGDITAPTADIALAPGQIATLGTVTFTP